LLVFYKIFETSFFIISRGWGQVGFIDTGFHLLGLGFCWSNQSKTLSKRSQPLFKTGSEWLSLLVLIINNYGFYTDYSYEVLVFIGTVNV